MTKEESLEKLCSVLYNGIKTNLKAFYTTNIDTIFLPNKIECELRDEGITIYDHDTNPYDKTIISFDKGIENIGGKPMLIKAAIALLFLMETFAQGHKYSINWERGINNFGEFSPAIVFDEEQEEGVINYYIQMVNILADGVGESEK